MSQQADKDFHLNSFGTVKWYAVEKGFGFISGDDGADYFVAARDVAANRVLREGDRVEFVVGRHPRGPKAQQVNLSDAAGPARRLTASEQASALSQWSRRFERLLRRRFGANSGTLTSQVAELQVADWMKMWDAAEAIQTNSTGLAALLKSLEACPSMGQQEFEDLIKRLETVFDLVNKCNQCEGKGTILKGIFFPDEVPCPWCNGFGKFIKP